MPEVEYNPKEIEPKWQEKWLSGGLFQASDTEPKKKFYVLDMFPYPSGDGLHVGHGKIYTASDVVARYLRMKGYNVLHPTGWDAFGLPTENSAIKSGVHPAELTKKNVDHFREQMQRMGWSYDWSREVNTTDPEYYKWTQWIFLQLFRMKLAYEDTVPINWCPSCKTGLANEEVIDGKCERCSTPVEQKPLRQWMLRITKYADRLLQGLDGLDWPKFVLDLQHNWIGKSEGYELTFRLDNGGEELQVFTTRPDTIFGATYVVISHDHPMLDKVVTEEQRAAVEEYRSQAAHREETQAEKQKTGVFSGSYAVNPATNEKIPIWIADYVLMSYGTGAIMAVPAHDQRDFEFAKAYDLPITQVIQPELAKGEITLPYTERSGVLVNSGQFTGQEFSQATESIIQKLQLAGQAKAKTQYKLRDWVFSRQRYWGEPIPIIHCEKCGTVPVPEKDLPVTLPEVERYEPTGTGESPLAAIEEWVNVKCPMCPGMGKRETNTMPQWAGSSWYWLRYISPNFQEGVADPALLQKWMPVDLYVGGSEHAVLHLLYARFWSMALKDIGIVSQDEPFKRFRATGLVIGEDGQKMSKSRGNVINPDDMIEKFGADTLRVYEMFMGPFENSVMWNTASIQGVHRFLKRMWVQVLDKLPHVTSEGAENQDLELKLHQTIRRVSESTEQFKFNTAVSSMMEFLNELEKHETVRKETLDTFVLLLAPYAPHIAEELWEKLGYKASLTFNPWPQFNEKILSQARATIAVQVNGKVRGTIEVDSGISQEEVDKLARAQANVAKHLEGAELVKVIFVENRLINFVVKPAAQS